MLKIVCNQHITKSSELNVQKLPSQASEYSGVKNILELVLKCLKFTILLLLWVMFCLFEEACLSFFAVLLRKNL